MQKIFLLGSVKSLYLKYLSEHTNCFAPTVWCILHWLIVTPVYVNSKILSKTEWTTCHLKLPKIPPILSDRPCTQYKQRGHFFKTIS